MNRSDLFALAAARGWKSRKPLPSASRAAIRADLHAGLTQAEIEGAVGHPTRDEAVDALMEELS